MEGPAKPPGLFFQRLEFFETAFSNHWKKRAVHFPIIGNSGKNARLEPFALRN
jgi:hypothetical protein